VLSVECCGLWVETSPDAQQLIERDRAHQHDFVVHLVEGIVFRFRVKKKKKTWTCNNNA